jgi:hypothetical protein
MSIRGRVLPTEGHRGHPGWLSVMFAPTSDVMHRCMRWVLERTGDVPTRI